MDSPTQSSKPLLVPLTTKQERRVMDHLDERLLNLMRGYKKRSEESSTTPTLEAYLAQARYILSFTLQIPPIRPSAALRTAYLLRLTNDVLTCIPGYPATLNSLPDLLSWLDELDRAWQVVLAGQTWLPQDHTGVDPAGDEPLPTRGLITQTDRTRLKSMLISGSAVIEDWVGDIATQPEVDAADVEGMLQRLGIMERSVRIFPGTLDELERISGLG
ncbi:hypothetical protein BD626DRAFT_411391 [Schizophyllum amplum]|uniref:Uncharacterized protein n=1 Tax=Schizophyllum amplum TaxID=97359 RepID=A0A550BYZ4_9AGAR|nr:hypothetical protein BD626DRAFT_411391 [Auriculariopsis ampla]